MRLLLALIFGGFCASLANGYLLKEEQARFMADLLNNGIDITNLAHSNAYLRAITEKVKCVEGAYPPSRTEAPSAQKVVVNLDQAPEERWAHVVRPFAAPLKQLVDHMDPIFDNMVRERFSPVFPVKLFWWMVGHALPQQTRIELEGMALELEPHGISFYSLLRLNMFYELVTECTSIVAKLPDRDSHLIHGRNLDWGNRNWGEDPVTHQYTVSEIMRQMVIDVEFRKRGKVAYRGTTFAGIVLLLNGVKQNQFSFSMNRRNTGGDNIMDILKWAIGVRKAELLTVVSRRVFEDEKINTLEDAKKYLENVQVLSSLYFILGGAKGDRAHVITRSNERPLAPLSLEGREQPWLLQTNYDHWQLPPTTDDRRTPGNQCMLEKTSDQNKMSLAAMYDVLSTKPVLNLATIYTTLMRVSTGELHSFVRRCEYPCKPETVKPGV